MNGIVNRVWIPAVGLVLASAACTKIEDGGSIVGDASSGGDGSSSTSEVALPGDSDSGEESGDALSCQTASEGAGIAYVGEPEPGVWCVDEICELGCDFDPLIIGSRCRDAGATEESSVVECDGNEDCADAEVCCWAYETAECTTADACDENMARTRVCNSDADCNGGSCARAWSIYGALDLGACQTGPVSSCTATPGADCSGADLRGVDLWDVDLAGANFCDADLSNAELHGADLSGAVLTNADLSAAGLGSTQLDGADLRGADLTDAVVASVTFPPEGVADVVLADAGLLDVVLDGCDLRGTDLRGAVVTMSSLRGTDLRGADLRDAVFIDVDFGGADLGDALLDGISISGGTCPDGTPAPTAMAGAENACEGHLET